MSDSLRLFSVVDEYSIMCPTEHCQDSVVLSPDVIHIIIGSTEWSNMACNAGSEDVENVSNDVTQDMIVLHGS